MEHAHTTADRVVQTAEAFGLTPHLRMHVADAWTFELNGDEQQLDLIWLDFGLADLAVGETVI